MARLNRYGAAAVRVYRGGIDPLLRPLRPRIVRICGELGAREVVDIASATGAQCRALGRAGIRCTGVDLSSSMIEAAQQIGGRNVDYVHGSAYALPFGDEQFDTSLLLLALHEHSEPERTAMLGEALRVTRSDGRLIVAEYTPPKRSVIHPPWWAIRLIEAVAGEEHRAGFRGFVAGGGLDGLLKRHDLCVARRARSHVGTIGIAVVPARHRHVAVYGSPTAALDRTAAGMIHPGRSA